MKPRITYLYKHRQFISYLRFAWSRLLRFCRFCKFIEFDQNQSKTV